MFLNRMYSESFFFKVLELSNQKFSQCSTFIGVYFSVSLVRAPLIHISLHLQRFFVRFFQISKTFFFWAMGHFCSALCKAQCICVSLTGAYRL